MMLTFLVLTYRQRVVTSVKNKNRQEKGSGANKNPFKPLKQGVKQPPAANQWSNNQQYTLPEEFPFASSLQGGRGYVGNSSSPFDAL